MKQKMFVGLAAGLTVIASLMGQRALGQAAAAQSTRQVPTFQVDPTWPKLPNNWVMGLVSSVAVDRRDHVWILQRPRVGVPADTKGGVAPPVLEFDAAGTFVQAWGGPADEYEWPDQEHGIYVDQKDNVWIGGAARIGLAINSKPAVRSDDMLLKFTAKGKFLLQIGRRDKSGGSKDTRNVHTATDVFMYPKTNEVFVADGYEGPGPQGNHRVIVFDADTGAFKRMWGAFGNAPVGVLPPPPQAAATLTNDSPQQPQPGETGPGPQQLGIVHSIEISSDGLVYVADRGNRRVQVFTLEGKFVKQVFINRSGPSLQSAAGIAFSPDLEQRFMYVADFGNSHVVVLERKTLDVLYQFGNRSAKPGDFQGIHNLAADSTGNLYTAEVAPGARAQRFVFNGLSSPPAAQ